MRTKIENIHHHGNKFVIVKLREMLNMSLYYHNVLYCNTPKSNLLKTIIFFST
jgi:hypothetical protein